MYSGDRHPSPSPEAFTIRGHHLGNYAWLIRRGATPLEYAKDQHAKYVRARARAAEVGSARNLFYIRDVIGATATQGATWQHNTATTMTEFLTYSEHHPVELVAGRPDKICHTTINGEHCLLSHALLFGQESYIQRDGKQIAAFRAAGEQMGYSNDIEVFTAQTQFTDSEQVEAPAVRTTLGVVRAVLANPAFSWANTGPGNPPH